MLIYIVLSAMDGIFVMCVVVCTHCLQGNVTMRVVCVGVGV